MTERDYWETPPGIFRVLDEKYRFVLDACANSGNAKCKKFFTEGDNGLLKAWPEGKTVWCNPPYSRGQVRKWMAKAFREWKRNGTHTVMLLNYCVDRNYFKRYLGKVKVVFINPRIQFKPPRGLKVSGNMQGQILVLFGIDEENNWWDWKENRWGK